MSGLIGYGLFLLSPPILTIILLRLDPATRHIRPQRIGLYLVVMSALIWGALQLVASIASAHVVWQEIVVVLWFTIGWRLAWGIWIRTFGRLGQRWVRWGRLQRRKGRTVSLRIRLIPPGRAMVTACTFFAAFLSMLVTHRCKLADGQDPMRIFGTPFESVRIPTSDDLVLDGWFVPQEGAERTILICHGAGANKGNFVWFLGPLLDHGYNVLFFDFRAHGSSDGRVTTYGILERRDVLAAVEWLKRERPGRSRVIVGLGSSQGAMALALAAADEPRIDAIVLDSPFVSPRELARGRAGLIPIIGPAAADWMLLLMSVQIGANFFTTSAEEAVRRMGSRPVMVIHGDEDIIMPAAHSQRLYDAATGPKAIWFGPGPHSNIITSDPSGYSQRLFAFLDRHLGQAPVPPPRRARRPHSSSATPESPAPHSQGE